AVVGGWMRGPRLQAVAGQRRAWLLPGPVRVGWPAARRGLRARPVAGARPGIGARLDPLRRAARAAPRRAAGTAARPGRRGGGDASLVAPGRGVVRRPADILVVGAGPAAAQRRWAARGR